MTFPTAIVLSTIIICASVFGAPAFKAHEEAAVAQRALALAERKQAQSEQQIILQFNAPPEPEPAPPRAKRPNEL